MAPIFDPFEFMKSGETNPQDKIKRTIENYNTRFSAIGAIPPEPKKETNLLLKALDIIDRPRNAVLSGLTGQGFMKGLTGETHVNVADLLKDKIQNKYARGVAGFVGDVLLDPLTYLTVGTAGAIKGVAGKGLTEGAKYLKVAGQPIADVTPIANVIGKGIENTKLPELLGPVFSNKYIRRAVTSEEEMPDIQRALDVTRNTQRLIKGQQQEALDQMERVFKGLSPEAATQAAHIIETPTLLRKLEEQAAKNKLRPQVTVRKTGKAATLEDLLTKPETLPKLGARVPIDEALAVPQPRAMPSEGFEARPLQAVEETTPEVTSVGVRTPQVLTEPLIQAAKEGRLDKGELVRVMSQLNQDEQKALFAEISKVLQNKIPKPAKPYIKAANEPQVKFDGKTITEKELKTYKAVMEKNIADTEKGVAKYIRDAEVEAAKEGDIYRQIKERGGIRPGSSGYLKEEYKTVVPIGLRNKNGLPVDEMASELGMTVDELLGALRGRKPLTPPKLTNVLDDAVRLLEMDEGYRTKLRTVSKINELLSKVGPGEIPDAIRRLLPKVSSAKEALDPAVVKQVDEFVHNVGGNRIFVDFLKKLDGLPGTKPMKDSAIQNEIQDLATPNPKSPSLALPVNKALQVGFEKAPIPPGLKQAAHKGTILEDAVNFIKLSPEFAGKPDKVLLQTKEQLFSRIEQLKNNPSAQKSIEAKINSIDNELNKRTLLSATKNATPEARVAAIVAKKLTEETAAKDIAAGVQFTELPNYVRHLYKDPPEKVQTVLNQWLKERAKLPGKKAGFQKERKIPTIAEAKRLGLTPIEDVRVLTAVRELEGIQQRAINGMYRELEKIGSNVVRDINDAPAGWKALPGIKQLEGKAVHPEVERFISRFNSTINTDEGVRTMLSVLNGVQNFWKGLVTAPNPMFHVRNAMSNVFNNFLAGVVNPDVYRLAVIAQRGGNEVLTIGGKDYTAKELRKVFREKGLEGFGFFHGESPKSMIREASERFGQQSKLSKVSLIQKGRKVGDYLETNAKMAHFIDRLNKGYTPEQAAESARKYLFDYGDLTEAEKKIRTLVPFYTFTRKNLPLQLENLVTNPGKMSAVFKLSENAKATQGTQEGDMPEWMKSELAIPLDKKNYLLLDLPVNQLNMIGGGNTMKNFVGMMTPFAKIPVELAMGRQIFSGTPIEKYPGAVSRLGNLELPASAAYGLSQLGPLPRTAADIAGSIVNQEPRNAGNLLPPAPKQRPFIGTFVRRVDPERERTLALLRREQELADFRRYLEEVEGVEVPTVTELKKSKGRVF